MSNERKLIKIFNLIDTLNEQENGIFAELSYSSNNNKVFEIAIRSKEDFTYIQKCRIELKDVKSNDLDEMIRILQEYIGGASDE